MKIKTSELTGAALDWAVAKCLAEVHEDDLLNGTVMHGWWISGLFVNRNEWIRLEEFNPSTNWAQGGPIIERELIGTNPIFKAAGYDSPTGKWYWQASMPSKDGGWEESFYGPTLLIAAMRCRVASKLGDEVEVPDELA